MINRGPKSELDDELLLEIRKLVLSGSSYVEIRQTLGINESTWDTWVYKNYRGFRNDLNDWKYERLLKKSERLSEEILDLNYIGDKGVNSKLLGIKQKESEFIRSTLDKKNYSKSINTDITSGGESLQPVLVKFINDEQGNNNQHTD